MPCGKASGAAGSPSQSDEEYLSPQEEAMELGESSAPSKRVHFKEPPLFQVGATNQNGQLKTGEGRAVEIPRSFITPLSEKEEANR